MAKAIQRSGETLMDFVSAQVNKERDSNAAIFYPQENDREKIYRNMAEFACCEMSGEMLSIIMKEANRHKVHIDPLNAPRVRFYTLYDSIVQTNGDAVQLKALLPRFEQEFVPHNQDWQSFTLLEKIKALIVNEFKVQICIGAFITPKQPGDDLDEVEQSHTEIDFNVDDLEHHLDEYFPEGDVEEDETDAHLIPSEYGPSKALLNHGRTQLYQLVSDYREAEQKKTNKSGKKQQMHQYSIDINTFLEEHNWDTFVDALTGFVGLFQNQMCQLPHYLAEARGQISWNTSPVPPPPPPQPQSRLLAIDQKDAGTSDYLASLTELFKELGGTSMSWVSLTNKPAQEAMEAYEAVIKGQPISSNAHDDDEDDEDEVGLHGVNQLDPNKLNAIVTKRRVHNVGRKRAVIEDPGLQYVPEIAGATANQSQPSPFLPRKKRRKAIPWTQEETDALMAGVEKYKVGQWRDILQHYEEIFAKNNRDAVSLKDKYRNIMLKQKKQSQK